MAIKKNPVSPRQKMINLMYVVLMAMLALNVSSDVLNGFSLVDDSLTRTTDNTSRVNQTLLDKFAEQMQVNPTKVKEWHEKALEVKRIADSLYNLAEELKMAIVTEADGDEADIHNIRNREDLESATTIMLAPGSGRGHELYEAINGYRERILHFVTDSAQRRIIGDELNTDLPKRGQLPGRNWAEHMFENMPVAAAVTLLTKIQSDVRYAEGQVLHNLASNIDLKDIRVNQLNAYVIPNSRTVVQGGRFSAQIIMAAVDTTNRPAIYIDGKRIESDHGHYETLCNRTGDFTLNGYIETVDGSGQAVQRPFQQPYTVVAPTATVSADLMNVLYAGYSNPLSISVPGVPANQIAATMSGGKLTPTGAGKYIATPTAVGTDAVITVSARNEGRMQQMGQYTFRVRKLPDPTAYIPHGAGAEATHFRGGKIAKQALMNAEGIGAAIDDGLLNIPFRVQGFETVFYDNMGNAVPEISNSASFSPRQKSLMRTLSRGKRFYISHIRAIGPDGVERTLSGAMEVIIN